MFYTLLRSVETLQETLLGCFSAGENSEKQEFKKKSISLLFWSNSWRNHLGFHFSYCTNRKMGKLRQTLTAVSKAHHKTWFIHSRLNRANINHCSALRLHTSCVECGRDFVDIVPSKLLSLPPTTTLSYFSQSLREILLISSPLNVNYILNGLFW